MRDVAEAVQSLLRRAGEIHALVNNAGYALLGGLEGDEPFGSPAAVRHQLLWRPSGDAGSPAIDAPAGLWPIVNISSIMGFLRGPYMGIYAASRRQNCGSSRNASQKPGCWSLKVLLDCSSTLTFCS